MDFDGDELPIPQRVARVAPMRYTLDSLRTVDDWFFGTKMSATTIDSLVEAGLARLLSWDAILKSGHGPEVPLSALLRYPQKMVAAYIAKQSLAYQQRSRDAYRTFDLINVPYHLGTAKDRAWVALDRERNEERLGRQIVKRGNLAHMALGAQSYGSHTATVLKLVLGEGDRPVSAQHLATFLQSVRPTADWVRVLLERSKLGRLLKVTADDGIDVLDVLLELCDDDELDLVAEACKPKDWSEFRYRPIMAEPLGEYALDLHHNPATRYDANAVLRVGSRRPEALEFLEPRRCGPELAELLLFYGLGSRVCLDGLDPAFIAKYRSELGLA